MSVGNFVVLMITLFATIIILIPLIYDNGNMRAHRKKTFHKIKYRFGIMAYCVSCESDIKKKQHIQTINKAYTTYFSGMGPVTDYRFLEKMLYDIH